MGASSLSIHAEPPKLQALFPSGGQAGSSFVVSATGKVEADARLWTASSGIYLVPNGKKREWQVTIAADAPRGLHLIQCANAEGATTEPRWFSVGSFPEISEVEPNDEVGKPQPVEKLPVCINARLEKAGDIDGYAVKLEAGQTLVAMVEAYALGSSVDMLAHVLDDQGVRLHTASDSRNLDPVLTFKAPKAGRYILQLAGFVHPPAAEVRFTGAATNVYRLHLSAGPTVTQVFPAAVTLAGKTEVELTGHNIDPKKSKQTFEAKDLRLEGDLAFVTPPGAVLPIQVFVSEKPASLEKEPNNTKEQATPVQIGTLGGRIADKADVDRYAVTMKKGEKLQARVFAKRLGIPFDALLKVEGPDGKLIISADDESEQRPDPQVVWTAAVDGPHVIVVEDLFHQGGADKSYVVDVSLPIAPEVEITLADAKPLTIEAGKTATLKATVKLPKGTKDPHVVRVANLPSGVFASDVTVPEKAGEVEIKLEAATNAPWSGQPIQIEVWTKNAPFISKAALAPLRGENKRGTSQLDETSQVWLTVK